MARFKEVELKRHGCVSLVSRMYLHSYGFGDSYDVALKIFDEQVADLG